MVVASSGFFDGVHLGHRAVLERLVSLSRETGLESVVVTFWPHPRNVLQQDARTFRLLTSLEEKVSMIRELGVDRVEVLPFTKDFSRMTMRQYLEEVMKGRFGVSGMLLGYDNRVGCDCGSVEDVVRTAGEIGLAAEIVPMLPAMAGYAVSSTRIRAAIESGDVSGASSMLGYDYSLKGVVVAGNRLGRKIGFPTANMRLYDPLKAVPSNGVYEVSVETLGRRFSGMCNIGVRPTVSMEAVRTVETNIFGFDEDIYGLDIKVSFIRRIRDERRFNSLESLKKQLEYDKSLCENRL